MDDTRLIDMIVIVGESIIRRCLLETSYSYINKAKNNMERQEYYLKIKNRLMRSLVLSTFLYACESWTLTADI